MFCLRRQMRRSNRTLWKTTAPRVRRDTKDSTVHTVKVRRGESQLSDLVSDLVNVRTLHHFKFVPLLLEDINECQMQGICEKGVCLNTLGSFKCSCGPGLVLDRHRCIGEYQIFKCQSLSIYLYRPVSGCDMMKNLHLQIFPSV